MRTVVLVALIVLAGFVAAAPTASAVKCEVFEPGPVLDETYYFACGRVNCIQDGLPNIMVTCL